MCVCVCVCVCAYVHACMRACGCVCMCVCSFLSARGCASFPVLVSQPGMHTCRMLLASAPEHMRRRRTEGQPQATAICSSFRLMLKVLEEERAASSYEGMGWGGWGGLRSVGCREGLVGLGRARSRKSGFVASSFCCFTAANA